VKTDSCNGIEIRAGIWCQQDFAPRPTYQSIPGERGCRCCGASGCNVPAYQRYYSI